MIRVGIISLIIGLIGIPVLLIAFIPFLGWLNWINNFFVSLGWILGLIGVLRNKRSVVSIIGLAVCSMVLFFGFLRLLIGGGLL